MGVLEPRGNALPARRFSAIAPLPTRVYLDTRLTKAAIHIAGLLSACLNEDFEAGEFDLSSAVDLTGQPKTTMYRAIQNLLRAGWLEVRRERRPHNKDAIFFRFKFDNVVPMEHDSRYRLEARSASNPPNTTNETPSIPIMEYGSNPPNTTNETPSIPEMEYGRNPPNSISGTTPPYIESNTNLSGLRPKASTPKGSIDPLGVASGSDAGDHQVGTGKPDSREPSQEVLAFWELFQDLREARLKIPRQQAMNARELQIIENWVVQRIELDSWRTVLNFQFKQCQKKNITPQSLVMFDGDLKRFHDSRQRDHVRMPAVRPASPARGDELRVAFNEVSKFFNDRNIPGDPLITYEQQARKAGLAAGLVHEAYARAMADYKKEKRSPRSLFESYISKEIDAAAARLRGKDKK